jgi:hypothetical protein
MVGEERNKHRKKRKNIIKRAMEEADIVFGTKSPKLPFFLGEEEETEMDVESIKDSEKYVNDKEDEKVISEMNFDEIGVLDLTVCKERECKIVEEKIYIEESPLHRRIVRRREDRARKRRSLKSGMKRKRMKMRQTKVKQLKEVGEMKKI